MDLRPDIWRKPLNHPTLKENEIHVWRVSLISKSCCLEKSFAVLSQDEKRKSDTYIFERDRNRFIGGRGALRKILAGYLGVAPKRVRFCYNEYGKPFLDVKGNLLQFNLSHSNEIALFGVTNGQEIGIDVEFVNYNFPTLKVAESFFSPNEIAVIKSQSRNRQADVFFSMWTRREAIQKAVGTGFTRSLNGADEFQVLRASFSAGFHSEDKYAAALAVRGTIQTVRYWKQSEL